MVPFLPFLIHFILFYFYLFIYLFIWLHWVFTAARGISVAACGIFSCGMRDLVP